MTPLVFLLVSDRCTILVRQLVDLVVVVRSLRKQRPLFQFRQVLLQSLFRCEHSDIVDQVILAEMGEDVLRPVVAVSRTGWDDEHAFLVRFAFSDGGATFKVRGFVKDHLLVERHGR